MTRQSTGPVAVFRRLDIQPGSGGRRVDLERSSGHVGCDLGDVAHAAMDDEATTGLDLAENATALIPDNERSRRHDGLALQGVARGHEGVVVDPNPVT